MHRSPDQFYEPVIESMDVSLVSTSILFTQLPLSWTSPPLSWYPKKPDVESSCGQDGGARSHLSTSASISGTNSSAIFSRARREREEGELRHQLEIAKTMVIDLAQPRSPAHMFAGLTPSPRPSPTNRSKSSLVRSKKACSSSPHDRDGHYPCNRCGR